MLLLFVIIILLPLSSSLFSYKIVLIPKFLGFGFFLHGAIIADPQARVLRTLGFLVYDKNSMHATRKLSLNIGLLQEQW